MPRRLRKSNIPFGSQFSPRQIDLPQVLELTARYEGDRRGATEAFRSRFFAQKAQPQSERVWSQADRAKMLHDQTEIAKNVPLALVAYGLVDRNTFALTDIGRELYGLRNEPTRFYSRFAQHVLLDLHGLTVLDAVRDLRSAGDPVTVENIALRLQHYGLYVPRGGTHLNTMRMWLEEAGVVDGRWNVNEDRVRELIGRGPGELEKLASLSRDQQDYLRALATLGPGQHDSAKVRDHATALYGTAFSHKSLPQTILRPLEERGLVTVKKTTSGRGAKPYLVRMTDACQQEVFLPLLKYAAEAANVELRSVLRQPIGKILHDLRSTNRWEKGRALEALAIRLGVMVGLEFRAWRLRSARTQGYEVDVIMEGAQYVFSRWQIQCKNTQRVGLDDVAKEVGLTFDLKSHVVAIVTTGVVGQEAKGFARSVMKSSSLNIIFLERDDLKAIAAAPSSIADILLKQSRDILELKAEQIGAPTEE